MILAIALVHLAAVINPGANFLVVSRNSLTYSRRSGLITARGVALGSLIYITIGVLGFATIISSSPLIFNLIKIVGAAYFLYTGVKSLWTLSQRGERTSSEADAGPFPEHRAFVNGLLTAISNPTSALYFLALFTTFLHVTTPIGEKLLTALVLIAISFTWYNVVAITFSHSVVRRVYKRFEWWLTGLIGILWLFLAVKLLAAT